MPLERYYLPEPLVSAKECVLTEAEHHHLAHVTRIKEGEEVEIINGCGDLATARVIKVGRRQTHLMLLATSYTPPPLERTLLLQALPKPNRLSTIVEKTTELGVTEIGLFSSERSDKKPPASQLAHAQQVAIAAMKQCGRLHLPLIKIATPLEETSFSCPTYYGDVDPQAKPFLSLVSGEGDIAVCIGPEGGFSPQEIQRLKDLGAIGISLHPNILRTDTAPIAALAMIAALRMQHASH